MRKIYIIAVLCLPVLAACQTSNSIQTSFLNPVVFQDVKTHLSFKQRELDYTFDNLYLNMNRIFTLTYRGENTPLELQFVGKMYSDLKAAIQYMVNASEVNGDELVSQGDLELSGNMSGALLVFKSSNPKKISSAVYDMRGRKTSKDSFYYYQKYIIVMSGKTYLSSFSWNEKAVKTEFDQKLIKMLVAKMKEANKRSVLSSSTAEEHTPLTLSKAQLDSLAAEIIKHTPEYVHFSEGATFSWVLLEQKDANPIPALTTAVAILLKKKYTVFRSKDEIPSTQLIWGANGRLNGYQDGFAFSFSVTFLREGRVEVRYWDWEGRRAASSQRVTYEWINSQWKVISRGPLRVS